MGSYNQIAGRGLDRLAALSDGLFAVAMTLIVLEIHVPLKAAVHSEHDLWLAVAALAPRGLTYLLSFLTLGIFWVGQQTQLDQLDHGDRNLAWLHLAFLATVAVMPFSTELLADFIAYRAALIVYWVNLFLLGATILCTWIYSTRAGLLKPDTHPNAISAIYRRIFVGQGLYALGALLCIASNYWAIGFIVLIQLHYAVAPRIPWLSRVLP
jgi:uncharacterized membrane protein